MNLSNGWHQFPVAKEITLPIQSFESDVYFACSSHFTLHISLYLPHAFQNISHAFVFQCFVLMETCIKMLLLGGWDCVGWERRLTQPLSWTQCLNFKAVVLTFEKRCEEPSEVMLLLRVEPVHLRRTVKVIWMTVDVSDVSWRRVIVSSGCTAFHFPTQWGLNSYVWVQLHLKIIITYSHVIQTCLKAYSPMLQTVHIYKHWS